jgi:hypothetical protein
MVDVKSGYFFSEQLVKDAEKHRGIGTARKSDEHAAVLFDKREFLDGASGF